MSLTALGGPPHNRNEGAESERVFHRRRLAVPRKLIVAAALVAAILGAGLLANVLAPADPIRQDLLHRLLPPSGFGNEYPLGTDELGRDVWSRLLHGARLSLSVTGIAVAIAAVGGVVAGLVSGYAGGWVEAVTVQATEIQLALPSILLAIVVAAVLGTSLVNLVIVLAIGGWVIFARVVHATTIALRSREFITAARATGADSLRLITYHILPNSWAPIAVIITTQFARTMLVEASLSFLGLGIQEPAPAWGGMLNDSRLYLELDPWLAVFPGAAIVMTVFAINLLGDALRELLDPRLRHP